MVYRKEDKEFIRLAASRYCFIPDNEAVLCSYINNQCDAAKWLLENGDLVGASVLLSDAIFIAVAYDSSTKALDAINRDTMIKSYVRFFIDPKPASYRKVARTFTAKVFEAGDYEKGIRILRSDLWEHFEIADVAVSVASRTIYSLPAYLAVSNDDDVFKICKFLKDAHTELFSLSRNSGFEVRAMLGRGSNFENPDMTAEEEVLSMPDDVESLMVLTGSINGILFGGVNIGMFEVPDVLDFYTYCIDKANQSSVDSAGVPLLFKFAWKMNEEDGSLISEPEQVV